MGNVVKLYKYQPEELHHAVDQAIEYGELAVRAAQRLATTIGQFEQVASGLRHIINNLPVGPDRSRVEGILEQLDKAIDDLEIDLRSSRLR